MKRDLEPGSNSPPGYDSLTSRKAGAEGDPSQAEPYPLGSKYTNSTYFGV